MTGRRLETGPVLVAAIIIAALIFVLVNVIADLDETPVDVASGREFPCTVLSVYDGDGPINCAEFNLEGRQVAVRLRGIEARENDNSCRYANLCPEASGEAARNELTRMATGRLTCTSFGPSYNSVDATCFTAAGLDLSCEMLRRGMAVRWPEYDPQGRLIPCVPQARGR